MISFFSRNLHHALASRSHKSIVCPPPGMLDCETHIMEAALMRYAQEMHDYTLRLWSDSRRTVEEQRAAKAAGKKRAGRKRIDGSPQSPREATPEKARSRTPGKGDS